MISGSGFRVPGSGFRVPGSGFRVQGLRSGHGPFLVEGVMSAKRKPMLSFEEYLAFERKVIDQHEFLDGQIYARAGESLSHSTICANLTGELHAQLKGKPCRTLSPNMKVRSGPYLVGHRTTKGMFSYADATVV